MSVSEGVVEEWLESFGRVWRERDAKAAAAIFTADAHYRNSPFLDEPFVGQDEIEGFWENAVADVSDVDFRYGTPVIDRDRVGVEWWTILRSRGEQYTLAGNFLLTFSGEKVSDLRESFVKEEGALQPHPGWGL
ncbi:nuclear transport factor 2 family protein [Pseudonocardia kujensis]|uniref:nuclear transport factor 2 family protein n=1 Tax=Pseudonocardia kujensis TaxID=1128675 RepID=UPI001E3E5424|nr:nuclear transport factor 2 family protein [Pseudonocardia kujensis]MCE0762495.1 nuclear transport factor 2 family protein [Pseudonocardia kujensis]